MQSHISQRGMALMSALLLLVVMTVLGMAMFRSFGLSEKIAGNTREKQRALHAAESAQTYAEWWLTSNAGVNATSGGTCPGGIQGVTVPPQICAAVLTNPSQLPWGGGFSYDPNGVTTGAPGTVGNYVNAPAYYISFLATSYDKTSGTTINSYQIDAQGYAGSTSSASVAESTYNVSVTYTAMDSLKKFQNLGGP